LRAAHFGEGEQEGERRLRALILVHPVDMQAIPAATTLSIIERETEIIAAVKPFECLVGMRVTCDSYNSPSATVINPPL
jgi:hypothetical protein